VPWLGAHFRIDALSAFFLVVVDLGAMSASLFALGYGGTRRRRSACCRSIRPSSPA
jgi:formate hydrogenlyase subunit 3/multisubunit Na+/H+ antiporter MnhD subunit